MTETDIQTPPNTLSRARVTEVQILVGAVVAVVIIGLLTVIFLPEPLRSEHSISDRSDSGTSLLSRLLQRNGFQVSRITSDPLDPTPYDIIFVLNPPAAHTEIEVQRIQRWVSDGGILIVADNTQNANAILEAFEITITDDEAIRSANLSLTAPTLTNPPFDSVQLRDAVALRTKRSDAVIHLSANLVPVMVSVDEGSGTVYAISTVYPFLNTGIRHPASPRLIANMLEGANPRTTHIGFDEGQLPTSTFSPDGEEGSTGLVRWLMASNAGRGFLLLLVLLLTYSISTGRRFGAPVPMLEDRLRREPVEYIVAMANLFRRSKRRTDTLQHYRNRLRRRLSERYAIDPTLADNPFVKQVSTRDPSIDARGLFDLLQRLNKPDVSENDMLTLAGEVDMWMESLKGKGI